MSRDGNGVYSLPSGNPVSPATTISSTVHNNTMSDIATALTGSLTKDGQAVASANQPMGGYKHTNVAVAAAQTDYARASQVQNGSLVYLTSVSGTNTITATGAVSMAAYATGMALEFIPAATNTGPTTINVNSIGAKSIFFGGAALTAGELTVGVPARITYDGTRFHLHSVVTPVKGYISGLLVTNNSSDASHDIDISAGQCQNAANTKRLGLTSAITKKLDAAFAAGTNQGALADSVALPTSGTIHIFIVSKDSDGSLDIMADTDVTGANVAGGASGYSVERRIDSLTTDSSDNLIGFTARELGGGAVEKLLLAPVADISASNPGTSAVLATLSAPTGIKVGVLLGILLVDATPASTTSVWVSSPDQTDAAGSSTNRTVTCGLFLTQVADFATLQVRTDTSARVRYRFSQSTADHSITINTHGWILERI